MIKMQNKNHTSNKIFLIITIIVLVALFITSIVLAIVWWPFGITKKEPDTFVIKSNIKSNKVVAIGDITCDPAEKTYSGFNPLECQDIKVKQLVDSFNPEKLLLLGDIQYNEGKFASFVNVFDKRWGDLKNRFLPAPGNHEYETKNAAGYFAYFNAGQPDGIAGKNSQGYYYTKIGDWGVYSLNSNCPQTGDCNTDSTQMNWLREELGKHGEKCQLAFWHHPLFSSSTHGVVAAETNRMPAAWQILQENKAELVLTGHDHSYERFEPQTVAAQADPNGIREFVVGTGGRSLYPKLSNQKNSAIFYNSNFGILQLELFAGSYSWQFTNIDGVVIDKGVGQCS